MTGTKLREVRIASNKTLEGLAGELRGRGIHVSPSYLSMIERGERTNPSHKLCVAIAESLGYQASQAADLFLPSNITSSEKTGTDGN